jgi:hypothetical protein
MALVDMIRYVNHDSIMIYGSQVQDSRPNYQTKRNPLSKACKSFEFQAVNTSVSTFFNESFDASFDKSNNKGICSRFLDYQSSSNAVSNMKNFQNSLKYKTEICKNFEINKTCKWGASCCFAHGREELRIKSTVSHFFKTKICKNFNKYGFCAYASRC